MFAKPRIVFITLLAVFLATAGLVATVSAQNPGISPHPVDKLAIGAEEVKQLLLLMDTDKNGKISKQEFMNFMEAEFDRLDKDNSRQLDIKELADSKIRVSHRVVGK